MTENTKAPYQISESLEYCDCIEFARFLKWRNKRNHT